MKLKCSKIFESVIGEAQDIGIRATFLRLAGCSMACKFCDTNHKEKFEMTEKSEKFKELLRSYHNTKYLVITGGEPFEQAEEVVKLLKCLEHNKTYNFDNYYFVNIQTNGNNSMNEEFYRNNKEILFSISPKFHKLFDKKNNINIDYLSQLLYFKNAKDIEIKLVGVDWIENFNNTSLLLEKFDVSYPIYFQYCWSKKDPLVEWNIRKYIDDSKDIFYKLKFAGYDVRYSIQLHKLIKIK